MTILYLYTHKFLSWRKRLAGIYRYARDADWHVEAIEASGIHREFASVARFWEADGFIVEGGLIRECGFSAGDFRRKAVVYCDPDGASTRGAQAFCVRQNSCETARRALDALLSLGFRSYGFAGYFIKREWSMEREKVFRRETAKAGRRGFVFEPGSAEGRSLSAFTMRLKEWMETLPTPCGILAANDSIGVHVLRTARNLGLSVPDEIAVVGIDDDELLCENTRPTLASIAPDFEQSGYMAAGLLAERLANPRLAPKTLSFGASFVVPRRSLRHLPDRDPAVARAVEYIRLHACGGMRVNDAIREMGMCRRSGEMRFRKVVGRSIQDEISAVRIARAKELLARKNLRIDYIHTQCGYRDERSLRHTFRKFTGLSPAEFRKTI